MSFSSSSMVTSTTSVSTYSQTDTSTTEIKETKQTAAKKTVMGSLPSEHPLILVDVDGTLLLGMDQVNMQLVEALKKNCIHKIHLLTKMRMEDICGHLLDPYYFTREMLIAALKKEGIEVIKVITLADMSYNDGIGGPGAAYNELYLRQYRRIEKGELAANNYQEDKSRIDSTITFQSAHLKTSEDASKVSAQGHSEKSFVINWLLTETTLKCFRGNIVVVDDEKHQLDGINKTNTAVKTIHVNKKSDQAYFQRELSECLSQDNYILSQQEYRQKLVLLTSEMCNISQVCKKSLSFFGSKTKDLIIFENNILELIRLTNNVIESCSEKYFSIKTASLSFAQACSDKIAQKALDSIFRKINNSDISALIKKSRSLP